MKMKDFFKKFGIGAGIGMSMIIPGISGGTAAVIFGFYEELISAINHLRYEFKKSFTFLLPIVLGALLAIAMMYFPIKYALEYAPLPTMLLFVGLMIGSIPKLVKDGRRNGFHRRNIFSITIPFIFVIAICFIPSFSDVNLDKNMPIYGYILLVMMGILSSCALVVPGISGSMLLFIFGYYKPILDSVSGLATDFGHSLVVLLCFALGILIGFFGIARIMKFFLSRFPRGTYWVIIGFVLATIPAIFITFDYSILSNKSIHIFVGVVLCISGAIFSFIMVKIANKKRVEDDLCESR